MLRFSRVTNLKPVGDASEVKYAKRGDFFTLFQAKYLTTMASRSQRPIKSQHY